MSDIDTRFTTAVGLLQDAYVGKTQVLQSELARCQQVHQHNADKISGMEDESRSYNRKIKDLEAQLNELRRENEYLLDSRSKVVEKYNLLKQHSLQLQSIRKQIASMVSLDIPADHIPDIAVSPVKADGSKISPMRSTSPSNKIKSRSSRTNISTGGLSSDARYDSYKGRTSTSPYRSTTISTDLYVDPDVYFAQVKRVLDAQEFVEFSANIKRLNNGTQSVETTLERARAILGESRPFLFSQFQTLVKQSTQRI